jgi:hypothetical protein
VCFSPLGCLQGARSFDQPISDETATLLIDARHGGSR